MYSLRRDAMMSTSFGIAVELEAAPAEVTLGPVGLIKIRAGARGVALAPPSLVEPAPSTAGVFGAIFSIAPASL
jgi:hypothetical protein